MMMPYADVLPCFLPIVCLECKSPLGVEGGQSHSNAAVKDKQMTASSFDPGNEPHLGRMNMFQKMWCPLRASIENRDTQETQYLQIDFIQLKKIRGVSTQGFERNYVTTYALYYAVDEAVVHGYADENGQIKVGASRKLRSESKEFKTV